MKWEEKWTVPEVELLGRSVQQDDVFRQQEEVRHVGKRAVKGGGTELWLGCFKPAYGRCCQQ